MRLCLYCTQQDVLSYDTNELSSSLVALDNSWMTAMTKPCTIAKVSVAQTVLNDTLVQHGQRPAEVPVLKNG